MGNDVFVFLEARDGVIHKSAWQALTLGKTLADQAGGSVVGVALGAGVDAAAKAAGGYGAAKVLHHPSDELKAFSGEGYSRVIASLVKEHSAAAILLPATSMGKDLAPRVAARLEVGVVPDVTALSFEGGSFHATRPVFAGKLNQQVTVSGTLVASIRPNAFAANETAAGTEASVEAVSTEVGPIRDAVVEVKQAAGGKLDVAEADVVVSGGRGLGDNDNYEKLILPLAELLGAANGASRAIVDAGWRPHGEQVGQTGKTVSPRLYIAIGISGAIQHKAGMDSSKCIVAINKDKDAPIFKFADYGIVGDVNEIVPKLTDELKAALN